MGIVARMLNALETERLKYLRRAKSRNPYTEGIEAGLSIAQGIVKQEAKQQASPLSRLDRGIGGEGMNKEEQIQGMAEFLEAQCAFETWADNERCAQAFYAAGYRKVTKPKVLSDAEIRVVAEEQDLVIPEGIEFYLQTQLDSVWKAIRGEE